MSTIEYLLTAFIIYGATSLISPTVLISVFTGMSLFIHQKGIKLKLIIIGVISGGVGGIISLPMQYYSNVLMQETEKFTIIYALENIMYSMCGGLLAALIILICNYIYKKLN